VVLTLIAFQILIDQFAVVTLVLLAILKSNVDHWKKYANATEIPIVDIDLFVTAVVASLVVATAMDVHWMKLVSTVYVKILAASLAFVDEMLTVDHSITPPNAPVQVVTEAILMLSVQKHLLNVSRIANVCWDKYARIHSASLDVDMTIIVLKIALVLMANVKIHACCITAAE